MATWCVFAPSFLWIFAGAPFIEDLRRNQKLAGALAAITAAVIGGTSLFGGRVSIGGVLTGTLLAVILQDGLVVVGLSPFYQLIAVGVVGGAPAVA